MSEKTTTNNLLDFNWDDDNTFFGVETTQSQETNTETEESSKETQQEESNEEEETEEVTFFGETVSTEESSEEEESSTQEETSDSIYNDLYSDLKDRGILSHIELEEGEVLDAERFLELQEQDYEQEVANRLKQWAQQDLDEDAQAFISFKSKGGSTEDFFRTYQSSYELPQGDIEDESYQDRVIRYQLKKEGWDADEIEDRLEYLTSNKKKESFAKRYNKKLASQIEKEKEALIQQVEEQKLQAKQEEERFKTTVKDTLGSLEEVNGFKITKKDQTDLYNMLTRKQYKTNGGGTITGFQKKMGEVFQDPEKMVLLAKLLNNDFDMSDFAKKTVTKKTREIKSKLEKRQNLRPSNSGSSLKGTGLADLFN